MSFWKKLFGGAGAESGTQEPAGEPVEHKGFSIRATPFTEGGQYQTCGVISKEIGGDVKEHTFIRADRFASKDDAVDVTLRKARQIIDEQGERIFG
ncbi:HlyU family transcriptional regulator [Mesorhizobium sp. CAU 1732]|uniref:HlyU family transcriptional regulator n=1 Tax=Mesorhizobium sp. CAU 1732 TaxID=3140358 RepID=UPI003260AC17